MSTATEEKRPNRRRRVAIALIVLAVLLVAAGVFLWLNRPKPSAPKATVPLVDPNLFPTPAGETAGYRVKMPEIGIDLPVVHGDGWSVALYQAALYPGMKEPGQGGRSLLYAHAQTGMFGPLLGHGAVGQKVDVQRDNAATLHYKIQQYLPKWPSSDTSILQPVTHEELVLLTCTTYNANDPRVVAIAEPDNP